MRSCFIINTFYGADQQQSAPVCLKHVRLVSCDAGVQPGGRKQQDAASR